MNNIPLFADLPSATQAALAQIAVPLRRKAGEVIVLEGAPTPGVFIVTAGRVKLARSSAAGREQVLHVLTPGQHVMSVPAFDGGACPVDVLALTDSTLLLLPHDRLRNLMVQHPMVALAMLAESMAHIRHFIDMVDDFALHSVQGRLAQLLLDQAVLRTRGERVPVLSHAEMAARLGTVREMVGRTLKIFESLGYIRTERGTIHVLDQVGLEAQAER